MGAPGFTAPITTQRQEPDRVRILSGVFEGVTTGTSIGLVIDNVDQKSKDYGNIKDVFRPAHADYTYNQKYGFRDYRGGGRSSARETAMRVAAGAVARKVLSALSDSPISIRGALVGAFLVGTVDTLARAFLPTVFRAVLPLAQADGVAASVASMSVYILMAAVLLWRPRGLFAVGG